MPPPHHSKLFEDLKVDLYSSVIRGHFSPPVSNRVKNYLFCCRLSQTVSLIFSVSQSDLVSQSDFISQSNLILIIGCDCDLSESGNLSIIQFEDMIVSFLHGIEYTNY